MGLAGSLYSPLDFLAIDPNLIDKNDKRSPEDQVREFTKQCHKRGIKVMLDLPSCASVDFAKRHPEMMAKDATGKEKTPGGWQDIRMLAPFSDEQNRVLNEPVLDMHKHYVKSCTELGVDGIRADVGRAKPVEFWNVIISIYD